MYYTMATFKVKVTVKCNGIEILELEPESIEATDNLIVHDGARAMWDRGGQRVITCIDAHFH